MNPKIIFGILLLLLCTSCKDKDDSEKRVAFAEIVESRSTQDLLNDLYVGSDGDVEAISRILNVTPSSIERIRSGETESTVQFDDRVHEIALYYMLNDQKFSKLQSIVDPEYGWYDSILNFPSHHPWWFWILTIIIVLSLFIPFVGFVTQFAFFAELAIFLIAWIASLCCSPDAIQDPYVDAINPTIEMIK